MAARSGPSAALSPRARTPGRPKYYVLEMFPYPSGKLHVGHVRNYTMGDLVARYRRAQGFNVLHPMGWDAFGLPAENAAIASNVHPATWTNENIATMRGQLQRMGFAYDWSREIATCHPEYYRHEQKMFLDFLAAGLAYRKESWVNWDPVDHTVLANEQVIDGRGWRSGALVEKRLLAQWFLRITEFSDELLEALKTLDRWPEQVRLMQENWIGRSEGARSSQFAGCAGRSASRDRGLHHPARHAVRRLLPRAVAASSAGAELAGGDPELAEFVAECDRLGTSEAAIEAAEKIGYDTGLKRCTRSTRRRRVPVYVANFVLMEYGTGAIFGCPAHDQRDLDFARKYGLPVIPVVLPPGDDPGPSRSATPPISTTASLFNSDFLDGLRSRRPSARSASGWRSSARGERTIAYRLRDWGVSRQRYWGCPIPVIHCAIAASCRCRRRTCRSKLPEDVTFDQPGNPLDRHPTWKHVDLPALRQPARARPTRSTPSSNSSWYFLRFCSPARRCRSTARRPITGCRSTSISAASSTRSCTCSIPASSLAR